MLGYVTRLFIQPCLRGFCGFYMVVLVDSKHANIPVDRWMVFSTSFFSVLGFSFLGILRYGILFIVLHCIKCAEMK